MKIALYGGSFNPPHLGHFRVIDWLCQQDFDQVWVIPCVNHAFGKDLAPVHLREQMLLGLLKDKDADLSKIQIHPREESRTFDLVTNLKKVAGSHKFTVVGGTDLLLESHRWYRWADLQKLAEFIYIGRDDYPVEGYTPPISFPGASSSQVKACLAKGSIPDGLTPRVVRLIQENLLYKP